MREHFTFHLLIACAITVVATLVGLELAAQRVEAPYLALLPAVVIAFVIGGSTSAWLSAAISAIATWFYFIPPVWSFRIEEYRYLGTLALFVVVAALIVRVLSQQRRLVDELADANSALRKRLLLTTGNAAKSFDL